MVAINGLLVLIIAAIVAVLLVNVRGKGMVAAAVVVAITIVSSMTGLFLTGAYTIGGLLFVNRNKRINSLLLIAYEILLWGFTIFACFNYKHTELDYFAFDSLGILLLITLSIISIPALIHSHLYISRQGEKPQSRSIYFAAMVVLLTSISAAYLANHIAVVWIFAELTTLSASALIYHHRNKLALEGTCR